MDLIGSPNRRDLIKNAGLAAAAMALSGCSASQSINPAPVIGASKGQSGMLKGIPSILSPELVKTMMEMGHGDELVLADGNFPSASIAQRLVRADGHGVPAILEAVLNLFPLDPYVDNAVFLMQIVPGDKTRPTIWEEYRRLITASKEPFKDFEQIERFAFYERAKKAFAVVATGESALYANIILKKGVIKAG